MASSDCSPQPSLITVQTTMDGVLMCWSTISWTWSSNALSPAALAPGPWLRLGMSCQSEAATGSLPMDYRESVAGNGPGVVTVPEPRPGTAAGLRARAAPGGSARIARGGAAAP